MITRHRKNPFLQKTPSERFKSTFQGKIGFGGEGQEERSKGHFLPALTLVPARARILSRDHRGIGGESPEAASEGGGNAASWEPRTSDAPSPRHRLRRCLQLPGSPDAAGLRSEYYRAVQPLPQQPRADQNPTATYPPRLAQGNLGSFLDTEVSLESPPMPERYQHVEAGLSAHGQSSQTQSTSPAHIPSSRLWEGLKKHGWRQTPVVF